MASKFSFSNIISRRLYYYYIILHFSKVLGIDTEFCSVESLITGIVDNWEEKLLPHRRKVAVVVCIVCFLLGLPMVTNVSLFLSYNFVSLTILSWYLYFHHIYLITFNHIFLKFRVESTCFKSWTFMPLLDCLYYGFASLKRLPSPGFMALIDLQGISKVWPEANHIFFGIFAGHALLPLSWQ